MNKRQLKKRERGRLCRSKHWKKTIAYLKTVGWLTANDEPSCEALMQGLIDEMRRQMAHEILEGALGDPEERFRGLMP